MSRLTDEEVSEVAARIAERLALGPTLGPKLGPKLGPTLGTKLGPGPGTKLGPGPEAGPEPTTGPESRAGPGLFVDVDSAVDAAGQAFRSFQKESLALRDRVVAAMRDSMLAVLEEISRMAVEETGLGRVEDKIVKNRLVAVKTPGTEALLPHAVSGDCGLMLLERAPYGVIGAITPVTNPTSTIICNSIGMLAAGNAVVFNAHPSAKGVSCHVVRLLNRAIRSAGGPADLICAVAEPTIESAKELMRHPGVRLLVVTGGAGVVVEAMRSGKRAICAGPGNPPVVVDESADIESAARDVVLGASFDNNVICTDEKEVFVVASVADALLQAMIRNGAYRLRADELRRVEQVIFKENRGQGRPGVVNTGFVGKDAARILSEAGIRADSRIRLAVAEVPAEHPLVWTEQMMPVLPVVRVENADRAIDLARQAEQGCGHSAVMHSRNLDHLSRMAREMNTTIFVKNGPCYAGLGEGGEGHASFTIASPTGEGMTGPRSFSRERRCVLVDHFRIV
ncbi:MAG: aldehyde dehydrogenase EutE [Candidatus Eisenbacteria bacterium]|nr:aldehyde dehydrogenase EutE [Candidatus Eisenbacteria bacterium]